MAGKKRERELARAKYERQQAKRAANRARRRRRNVVVASVLTGVLVLGGLGMLIGLVGDDGSTLAEPAETATTKPGECAFQDVPAQGGVAEVSPPPAKPDTSVTTATIRTNRGDITLSLLTDKAPCTVHNFVYLAREGYYDGTTCHRLLATKENSALQCGDPSGSGQGGPGYQFADENLAGATYGKGTVAMANSGPNTNGSQFFMVYEDSTFNGPFYTPFATVTKGLDVLEKVGAAGADDSEGEGAGKPKAEVVIEDVTVS